MSFCSLYTLVDDYWKEAVLDTLLSGQSISGSTGVTSFELIWYVPLLNVKYLREFDVLLQLHRPIEELETLKLDNQDVWKLLYLLLVVSSYYFPLILIVRERLLLEEGAQTTFKVLAPRDLQLKVEKGLEGNSALFASFDMELCPQEAAEDISNHWGLS